MFITESCTFTSTLHCEGVITEEHHVISFSAMALFLALKTRVSFQLDFFIVMWTDSTASLEDVNEVGRSHRDQGVDHTKSATTVQGGVAWG